MHTSVVFTLMQSVNMTPDTEPKQPILDVFLQVIVDKQLNLLSVVTGKYE